MFHPTDPSEAFCPPGILPKGIFMGSQILLRHIYLFVCVFPSHPIDLEFMLWNQTAFFVFITYCYITIGSKTQMA